MPSNFTSPRFTAAISAFPTLKRSAGSKPCRSSRRLARSASVHRRREMPSSTRLLAESYRVRCSGSSSSMSARTSVAAEEADGDGAANTLAPSAALTSSRTRARLPPCHRARASLSSAGRRGRARHAPPDSTTPAARRRVPRQGGPTEPRVRRQAPAHRTPTPTSTSRSMDVVGAVRDFDRAARVAVARDGEVDPGRGVGPSRNRDEVGIGRGAAQVCSGAIGGPTEGRRAAASAAREAPDVLRVVRRVARAPHGPVRITPRLDGNPYTVQGARRGLLRRRRESAHAQKPTEHDW